MTQRYLLLFLWPLLLTCTEQVEPVIQFEDGFLLINGRLADREGVSEVTILRSVDEGINTNPAPVAGARVLSIAGGSEEIEWVTSDVPGRYVPPAGWVAEPGVAYHVRVETPAGEMIESTPEQLLAAVTIDSVRVEFEQEAYFSESRDRFVPAFRMLIDYQDPAGERNYYQYRTQAFEEIDVCAFCERSVYRNGECIATDASRFVSRYDYRCDSRCWRTRLQGGTFIFSDEFTDGTRVTDYPAARVDYQRPGGLLFVLQQFNISRAAFEYNAIVQNLVEGAGGLNAPLPAALVGNLRDVSSNETTVLGFIGTAAVTERRRYIVQESFGGLPLPFDNILRLEPLIPAPPRAPCIGGNRTATRPEGWPN